ncbi:hypothetical protein B6J38_16580 [Klebsiella pneumoniae]|nr:hypothetical protein B6J38_16580 [Klebsiella pneumoniae]
MSFRLQLGEVSVAAGETTDRETFLRRVAAAPDPAYVRMGLRARQVRRPAQASAPPGNDNG